MSEDKELTIGYIGGSVTNGAGLPVNERDTKSWRAITTSWFRSQFPDAEIKEKCMAIGGTGTIYALYRMEKALLKSNIPDLVFIETAINDSYDGVTGDTLREYYESLIKKIYTKNPKCNIVIVITGDCGSLKTAHSTGIPFRPEHREIAQHYNIPVIDVGSYLYEKIFSENGNQEVNNSNNNIWKKYFSDIVHPLAAVSIAIFFKLKKGLV